MTAQQPALGLELVPLEDFVPFDQSVVWRVHDAYYATLGAGAFLDDIPSRATTNTAFARQHVHYLAAGVRQAERSGTLAPDAPVHVLELGAGAGEFAASFLDECVRVVPRLAARLRYVVSDYSRRSVEDALAFDGLVEHVESGRAVGACYDLRRPKDLRDLSGAPLGGPFLLVVANYLCCVAQAQAFQRRDGRLFERYVRVSAPASIAKDGRVESVVAAVGDRGVMASLRIEEDWRPATSLDEPSQSLHAAVVSRVLEPLTVGSLIYPTAFVTALDALRGELHPAGAVVISDYGALSRDGLEGDQLSPPQHYGNTLNYPVTFTLFDEFAAHRGLVALRTQDELRAVKVAALHPTPACADADVFARAFEGERVGEALVDLQEAASVLGRKGHHGTSARLLAKCRAWDPSSYVVAIEFIEACLDAEHFQTALDECDRAADVVADDVLDELRGRACLGLGLNAQAINYLQRSLEAEPDSATAANLSLAFDRSGDVGAALVAARRAVELDPDNQHSAQLLAELEAATPSAPAGEAPLPAAVDVVEDFVPLDQSVVFELSDAYLACMGRQAYVDAVPCQAAASRLLAEAHARLLLASLEDARAAGAPRDTGPVHVLDLGGGSGELAGRFLEAVQALAPDVAARGRYVLADVHARVVREALAQPALARFVAEGRLVGAQLERRERGLVRELSGEVCEGPWSLVLASYVCGSWPTKQLWLRPEDCTERWVRTRLPEGGARATRGAVLADPGRVGLAASLVLDDAWRPVSLQRLGEPHQRGLERWLSRAGAGPVSYPLVFIDALLALGEQLAPGGALVVLDAGQGSSAVPRTGRAPGYRTFGNTAVFRVNFELLAEVFGEQGWSVHRTQSELRGLSVLALARPVAPSVAAVFARRFEDDGRSEDYEDLWDAARALLRADQPLAAARLFKRALALDAGDGALWAGFISACLDAGFFSQALAACERAQGVDAPPPMLPLWRARSLVGCNRPAEAAPLLEALVAQEPSVQTFALLGRARAALGDRAAARRAAAQARQLAPQDEALRAWCVRLGLGAAPSVEHVG